LHQSPQNIIAGNMLVDHQKKIYAEYPTSDVGKPTFYSIPCISIR